MAGENPRRFDLRSKKTPEVIVINCDLLNATKQAFANYSHNAYTKIKM